VARCLRSSGYAVVGVDLAEQDTDLSFVGDVSDARFVHVAVSRAERELGPIDSVISVAGYYEMIPFSEISDDQWHRMLQVHLGGLTNVVRSTLPGMLERGCGSIVAISSEIAIGGGDQDAHYAAAKGAILGFVRSLAVEVAPKGIRVNAVAPGPCDTPLLGIDSELKDCAYLDTLPARQLAQPDEIAVAVQYLLDDTSFAFGEVISVNSGAVI